MLEYTVAAGLRGTHAVYDYRWRRKYTVGVSDAAAPDVSKIIFFFPPTSLFKRNKRNKSLGRYFRKKK